MYYSPYSQLFIRESSLPDPILTTKSGRSNYNPRDTHAQHCPMTTRPSKKNDGGRRSRRAAWCCACARPRRVPAQARKHRAGDSKMVRADPRHTGHRKMCVPFIALDTSYVCRLHSSAWSMIKDILFLASYQIPAKSARYREKLDTNPVRLVLLDSEVTRRVVRSQQKGV